MASLEARLQRVEFAMADNRDKVEDMDQRIDVLEGGNEEFHREMQGILNSLAESWKVQMDALKDSLQAKIAAMKEEIKEAKGDWSLCKMAVTQGGGDHEGEQKPSSPRHSRFNKGKRNGDKPKLSCFLCDGNHFARDCPQRAKLAALIRDDEEEPHQEEAKVGSLRLLNTIKAKVGKTKAPRKGRMYVEAKVRGFNTRALIDTGASHNFIKVKEAIRLGLQLKEEQGWIKAVNTEARPIYGIARDVRLHIGDWCGQADFTVLPMDDYPIVLGMEFLDGVRAFPIPFAETMCIMGEGSTCLVPLAREALLKSKTLSAMQLYLGKGGSLRWIGDECPDFCCHSYKEPGSFQVGQGMACRHGQGGQKDEEMGGQESASEASQFQAKGFKGESVGTEQLMSWIQSADDKHSKGESLRQFMDKIAKLRETAMRTSPDWVMVLESLGKSIENSRTLWSLPKKALYIEYSRTW
ncbi:hypothetical protein Acr_09g0006780 [Actinidia rufa]|uniref:Uncharacterized protein n=1 Tax=Actinidia rufa TaxID=165716 RepID=A0A7J0F692_9ERIC|nr:hypothetical protein Acr_09g0006780 [Actinidia rufa]